MRKHWLDNLRWVVVLSVLFYHVIYFYNNKGVFGITFSRELFFYDITTLQGSIFVVKEPIRGIVCKKK